MMSEADAKNPGEWHQRFGSVLAVLLTIAIVLVVFWQFRPGGESSRPNDSGDATGRDRFGGGFRFSTGIETVGENAWRAVAGPVVMEVSGKPATSFNFRMRMMNLLDDDTRAVIRAQRMLVQDSVAARTVGVSAEQLQKLQANEPPRMVLADEDQDRIKLLWKDFETASESTKPAAQKALLDGMEAIGQKSAEPTKKAYSDAAAAFREILTVEQIAKVAVYSQNSGPIPFGNPSPPATQPK